MVRKPFRANLLILALGLVSVGGGQTQGQPGSSFVVPIVWEGPFTVSGGETFKLGYWVKAALEAGDHANAVEATGGGVPARFVGVLGDEPA